MRYVQDTSNSIYLEKPASVRVHVFFLGSSSKNGKEEKKNPISFIELQSIP
jgi:hypothetical protein